jgi:hypothetical protein
MNRRFNQTYNWRSEEAASKEVISSALTNYTWHWTPGEVANFARIDTFETASLIY